MTDSHTIKTNGNMVLTRTYDTRNGTGVNVSAVAARTRSHPAGVESLGLVMVVNPAARMPPRRVHSELTTYL